MQSALLMHLSPKCQATSKRSGKPCQSPAVKGKTVCRMHGTGGGAPVGNRNALRHGRYTAEAIGTRRLIAELVREGRKLVEMV